MLFTPPELKKQFTDISQLSVMFSSHSILSSVFLISFVITNKFSRTQWFFVVCNSFVLFLFWLLNNYSLPLPFHLFHFLTLLSSSFLFSLSLSLSYILPIPYSTHFTLQPSISTPHYPASGGPPSTPTSRALGADASLSSSYNIYIYINTCPTGSRSERAIPLNSLVRGRFWTRALLFYAQSRLDTRSLDVLDHV